ncbi:MAG: chloride channel protein [Andreesenia angusta]|nr:chloride channel protein [Andreesenia angusta]
MSKKAFRFPSLHKLRSKLVIDGILVGILAGTLSVGYRLMLSKLAHIRHSLYTDKSIFIFILVILLASYIIHRMIKLEPLSSGSGIPQVQGELLEKIDMDEKKVLGAKLIGGGFANLVGMSLGREGPSIQIGAAGAKLLAKIMGKDRTERRYMISAGASAGLSAAFNAPISAALFALEEIHKNFSALVLIPCLIASVIADFISKNIFGLEPAFSFEAIKQLPLDKYYTIIIIGIFSGFLGVIFNKVLLKIQSFYENLKLPGFFKMLGTLIIVGIIGFISYDLLGGGHHLLESIGAKNLPLKMILLILIAKLLFTGVSYGSGAQGGIFLPVLVLGGLCGAVTFNILNGFIDIPQIYYTSFIMIGMSSMMTAVARSPIISILLVSEMTGSFQYILALCLASIVAYVTAELLKDPPIYHSLLDRLLKKYEVEESHEVIRYSEKTMLEYRIPISGRLVNKKLIDLKWPCEMLIVSIERGSNHFIPHGLDELQAGDLVTIFTAHKNTSKIDEYFKDSEHDEEEE